MMWHPLLNSLENSARNSRIVGPQACTVKGGCYSLWAFGWLLSRGRVVVPGGFWTVAIVAPAEQTAQAQVYKAQVHPKSANSDASTNGHGSYNAMPQCGALLWGQTSPVPTLISLMPRCVPTPCVTCSPSVVSLRGPGQSPVHSSPHDAASIFS